MREVANQPVAPSLRVGGDLQFFRLLLPVALGVRLIYAALLQLVPDESFYWVWSRHLAPGYFDHPPMIAFLIWIGTHLIGSVELGVRLMGVLMAIGAMTIIVWLASRVLRDSRAAVWVAVIWLTSPLLAGLGTIFTPDTPVTFFSVCALAFVTLIADRDDRADQTRRSHAGLWVLFGLFSGLAMLSKYTGVLLPASIALAMLFSRKGLAHYRRPWIYVSGVLAVLVFSPVIWWNATHHWASFLFQLHHGTTADAEIPKAISLGAVLLRFVKDVVAYVGGQAGIWTPILFVIALIVLVHYWRRYRTITQVDRVLLWSATLPLVLFGAATIRAHHTEANWPAFSYFPISLLIGRWLSESWSENRVNWARGGVQVALGVWIAMHVIFLPPVTRAILRLPYHIPHAIKDLTGHREVGRVLGSWSAQMQAPVVTNRHEEAGEAAFYMPGQPDVWCIGVGSRPTAFDYFDEQPNFANIPRVLWVGGHVDLFEKEYGYVEQARNTATFFGGRNRRSIAGYFLVRPRQAKPPLQR